MDLRGKVVLITGASSGIGAACARRFAREGAVLALTARSESDLQALSASLDTDSAVFPFDLAQVDRITELLDAVLARFGRIDVLVNNAGVGLYRPSHESAPADVRRLFEVNFFAPVELVRRAVPAMAPGSTIVNVSSIGGKVPLPWQTVYTASKYALHAYSDALRMELVNLGIHVLQVCPGYVGTGFASHALAGEIPPSVRDHRPLKITPEQCAEAIVLGVRKGKRTVVVPRMGWGLVLAARLFPQIVFARMTRMNQAGKQRSQ